MKPASRLVVGLVAALWIAAHAAPVLGGVLSFPQKYQEKDQWCWAGCSQAILEFYGVSKSQTEIAQYGTEGQNIWNWLNGSSVNPTRRGIDMILSYFGGIGSTPVESALSLNSLTGEVGGSKPPVIRWGWDSGGGHFVVAYGVVDLSTVYIMDPWSGPTVNDYNWVCRGSSHTWTHTLKMNSAPAPQPTPNPYAAYAYTYAYYGEYYTYYAYNYYYAYDYYGYLYYAYYFADYAHYYAYLAYVYDATYGNDYGYADYAYNCAYYGYLYALYAYYYETGDTYSYNAAICESYAYYYSYLVSIGQR